MSYILDALRRADAERSRGTVPGIHAQPIFAGPLPTAATRSSRGPSWATVAAVLALVSVLLAVVLWYGLSGSRPSGPAPTPPAVAATPAVAPPAPLARATPEPAVVSGVAAAPVAPIAASPQAAAPRSTAAAASAARSALPHLPVAAGRAEPRAATPTPHDGSGAAKAMPASPAATAAPRVYALAELPDDIRRGLPTLNVGGSMYSSTPADRVLILNGLVLHEGDHVSPDVQLLQIQLKSAVLGYRGYRYAISY